MRRWLWIGALALLAAALGLGWYLQRPVAVELPVSNRSDQGVRLLFYGAGLTDHVLIDHLAPEASIVVSLTLSGVGPVRVRAESERVNVDAQLAPSNAQLRREPMQFEIRPGNQFLLVPR